MNFSDKIFFGLEIFITFPFKYLLMHDLISLMWHIHIRPNNMKEIHAAKNNLKIIRCLFETITAVQSSSLLSAVHFFKKGFIINTYDTLKLLCAWQDQLMDIARFILPCKMLNIFLEEQIVKFTIEDYLLTPARSWPI